MITLKIQSKKCPEEIIKDINPESEPEKITYDPKNKTFIVYEDDLDFIRKYFNETQPEDIDLVCQVERKVLVDVFWVSLRLIDQLFGIREKNGFIKTNWAQILRYHDTMYPIDYGGMPKHVLPEIKKDLKEQGQESFQLFIKSLWANMESEPRNFWYMVNPVY